jgi:hypothetical protein
MRRNEPVEKRLADLRAKPSAGLDARVHRAIDEALAERKQTPSAGFFPPNIWRIIMKNRMTRWTAAGLTAAALAASILVLDKAAPSAFGLDQVIAAAKGVRTLHIKTQGPKDSVPNEYWIVCDQSGHVAKARYYLPATEDGAKLITWTPERTEIWFKSKHGFLTIQTTNVEARMQSLLEQSQPQLVTSRLKEAQASGKVEMDIQQPADQAQPVKIVVVNKTKPLKQVYWIDRKSDLITSIENYGTEGGADVLQSKMEFLDYNVPIDDKMFSLRDQLPPDVRIADQVTQVSGVAQGNLTDQEAAAQTARAFFQALIDKDYKKAGLVMGGELEQFTQKEYGQINVTAIVSVGPAVLQTNWVKRGYMVPCKVEITHADGQKSIWASAAYVRPGDNEQHPEYWNITGGISAEQAGVSTLPDNQQYVPLKLLPDNKKYEQLTPKQAAEAFFKACAAANWDEMAKFWPEAPTGEKFDRMKEYLGGLQLISLGEPYQKSPYSGWYVPYEIKLRPMEINVRVSNTNSAKRYVIYGLYDSKLKPMEQLEWNNPPETLPKDDAFARMSPTEVAKAYFDAMKESNWEAMGKVAPASDVEQTKQESAEMNKAGMDPHNAIPTVEVGAAVWSKEESAYFVKCRMGGVKKFNLAVRNDNAANRYVFDGGL